MKTEINLIWFLKKLNSSTLIVKFDTQTILIKFFFSILIKFFVFNCVYIWRIRRIIFLCFCIVKIVDSQKLISYNVIFEKLNEIVLIDLYVSIIQMIFYQIFQLNKYMFFSNSQRFSKRHDHSALFDEKRRRFQNKHLRFRWQIWKFVNNFRRILHEINHMFRIVRESI